MNPCFRILYKTAGNIFCSLVGRTFMLLITMILTISAGNTALRAQNLPELSDSATRVMNAEQEKLFGRQVMLSVRAQSKLSNDLLLLDYFTRLSNWIASKSPRNFGKVSVALAIDPDINAFAVPGGYITLNTGLIENTRTEAELASVIAHETGHQSQRHIARLIEHSKELTLPATAALIGGLLIGGEAGKAAVISTQAAVVSDQLSFSRTFEREADATGMSILAAAGYDPHAMPEFFDLLEQQNRLHGMSTARAFLSTHPVTSDRIADGMNRANHLKAARVTFTTPADELDFAHAKARTQALYETPIEATIKRFEATRNNPATSTQARRVAAYGLSIALMRNNQLKRAAKVLKQLRREAPEQLIYQLAEAELDYTSGDIDSAVEKYKALYQHDKTHSAYIAGYARSLLQAGENATAIRVLRKAIRHHPDFTWAFPLLAQAYGASGKPLNATFIRAQQLENEGRYSAALELLNPALNTPYPDSSEYLTASIKSLINRLKSEKQLLDSFKL